MKRFLVMLMVALFSVLLIVPDADARRMGGGRSMGKQSDMNRDAARPPAQSGQQAAPPAAGGAAAAAGASRGRSWMGPIAGIAAGLGLAALASHLGLGEEFGTIILMALVFFAILIAVRMFMAGATREPAAERLLTPAPALLGAVCACPTRNSRGRRARQAEGQPAANAPLRPAVPVLQARGLLPQAP
jgi:predicted lipid-binding transport protein (Tim44 family)